MNREKFLEVVFSREEQVWKFTEERSKRCYMFLCTGKRLTSMRKNGLGFFNMLGAGSEKKIREKVFKIMKYNAIHMRKLVLKFCCK